MTKIWGLVFSVFVPTLIFMFWTTETVEAIKIPTVQGVLQKLGGKTNNNSTQKAPQSGSNRCGEGTKRQRIPKPERNRINEAEPRKTRSSSNHRQKSRKSQSHRRQKKQRKKKPSLDEKVISKIITK